MEPTKDILDQPKSSRKGKVKKSGWNRIVLLILALIVVFVIYTLID